ncbi:phage tail protein [Natrialbaceae archaeon AArc-T1-2]|uniref:phage tail protein n=1 Tax=Natrialbaceae archaeon AArc-T1-2 TaxID=3053904 RepID=UPI00255AA00D|nr:phage tail protein [Natrialbaceae archaeon AArc-T1-2]WIV66076.1 phage tail protein [Natrialbaceae archaeon AArc-T1-2]
MTQPFVATNTYREWDRWTQVNTEITSADAVQMATEQYATYVPSEKPAPGLSPDLDIVDVDADDCGDVYLLTSEGGVSRYDTDKRELERIPCEWDRDPYPARAIAVTDDTIYVATGGQSDADGYVQAVSKRLRRLRWTTAIEDPVAMEHDNDDVNVLDAGQAPGTGSIVILDNKGRRQSVPGTFHDPSDLATDRHGNRYILARLPDGTGAENEKDELIGNEDENSTKKEDDGGTEETDGGGERVGERMPTGPIVWRVPSPEQIRAGEETGGIDATGQMDEHDDIEPLVTPDVFERTGIGPPLEPIAIEANCDCEVLLGVGTGDDGRDVDEETLYRYDSESETLESAAVRFDHPVRRLLLARDRAGTEVEHLYVLEENEPILTALEPKLENRLNLEELAYTGHLVGRFDSGTEGCQWHRVTLEDDTEQPGSGVRTSYFATDVVRDVTELPGIGSTIGDRLRAEGVVTLVDLAECPPGEIVTYGSSENYQVSEEDAEGWIERAREELEWQSVGVGDASDALLEGAVGRYLWIKLELRGGQFASPTVNSVRAYFPRQSYLRYMPDVYREDADEAFLERFLSIFESIFVDIEENIESSIRYMDPGGIPEEYIDWLERWLALEADETWSTRARRERLQRAPELFKYRGTRTGLLQSIQMFLEDPPEPPRHWRWALDQEREAVRERRNHCELSETEAEATLDRLSKRLFVLERTDPGDVGETAVLSAHRRLVPSQQRFSVLLPPYVEEGDARTIERLVRDHQPAHARGRTVRMRSWIQLAGDEHDRMYPSLLGVNSALVDREFMLEEAALGKDTALTGGESLARRGSRACSETETEAETKTDTDSDC